MSLLNQVLRDLQGRQAPLPQSQLAEPVRPVPGLGAGRYWWILFFLLIGTTLLGGIYAWSHHAPQKGPAPLPTSQTPAHPPVQPVITATQPVLIAQNRLAAIRLRESAKSVRLLLEFARPLGDVPQVVVDDRTLKILLADMAPDQQTLPQPQRESSMVENLKLMYVDQLWQLHVGLTTEAQIAQVRLPADDLNGERLAIDIFPLVTKSSKITENTAVPLPEVRTQPAPKSRETLGLAKTEVTLSPSDQAQKSYQRGLVALEKGQPGEAISLWRQALKFDPAHQTARKRLIGRQIMTDRAAAHTLFTEGLRLHDPLRWRTWYARTLLQTVGASEAVDVLLDAELETTADVELLALRAGLWQQTAEYQHAQKDYRRLSRLEPANGLYRFGLAVALDQLSDPTAAKAYDAALTLGLKPQLTSYAQGRLNALQQRTGG